MKHCILVLSAILAVSGASAAAKGRYVRLQKPVPKAFICLAELEVYGENPGVNLALGKPTAQSGVSWGGEPSRAVDGDTRAYWEADSCCHTKEGLAGGAWWEVDLGQEYEVQTIRLFNRIDFSDYTLDNAQVLLLDSGRRPVWSHTLPPVAPAKINLTPQHQPTSDAQSIARTDPIHTNLKPARLFNPADYPSRDDLIVKLYNPAALSRALEAYAKEYPSRFPDLDRLRQSLKTLDPKDPKAIARLTESIYFRLPGFQSFTNLLYVRRAPLSLPNNWQGNSSRSVNGYDSSICRRPLNPAAPAETLLASDAIITDLTLDFDASRVAFSTRKRNLAPRKQGYCVAEMNLATPGIYQEISPTNQLDIDYYDPLYLPNGRMLMVGTSGFQGVPCVAGGDYVGNLLLRYQDGTIRRLSYDQDNNWSPVMLPNGRCLYLRWEYADSAHYFSRILMTMNPDGTDQQEYYGSNSYWPNSLFYARPLPGSNTRFMGIVSGHHGEARKGDLVLFDVERGRRETEGAVQRLPGWGKPVENVTKDELVAGRRQYFLHPFPVSDKAALVSMQHLPASNYFFLALVDVYDVQYPLAFDPTSNLIHPIPLAAQPKPAPIPDRVDLSKQTATVNLVDIYNGPGLAGVPRGTVKKLRLYSFEYSPRNIGGHYLIGIESGWDPRVILGEVDVEPDGSCLFEVPANTPIVLQPLDAEGKHLQEMRSWFAAMPGEHLSCIGCHQAQNYAAPNKPTLAARKEPRKIRPFYGPRRGFDFCREVQNVLDRRCVGCHNGASKRRNKLGQPLPDFTWKQTTKPTRLENYGGKVPAEFRSPSYDALHPYVRRNGPEGDYHLLTPLEFHESTSELFQRLEKGHHGVVLSDEERDRLTAWAGMNVPYFGTWTELNANPKVIARRREMNRLYSNDGFDPEVVVNPYRPVAFEAPKGKRPKPPAVPFKAVVRGEAGAEKSVDLGNGQALKLRLVPAGEYVMGSANETRQEAQREVRIGRAFWMGETEISVAQFRAFKASHDNGVYDMFYKDQVHRGYYVNDATDGNPAVRGEDPKGEYPAVRVSWNEADGFCRWLSARTGLKVRLPTEQEWEWACRAGSGTPFSFGGFDTDFAPFANLAGEENKARTVVGINPKPWKDAPKDLYFFLRDSRFDDGVVNLAKCGSFRPNAWGLKDMHGNAAEWTASPYPAEGGERKTVRGGSFSDRPHLATSSWRWGYPPWMKPFSVGFRVVVEQ